MTCCDELWISYYAEKYMLYYRCNDWHLLSSHYMTFNFNFLLTHSHESVVISVKTWNVDVYILAAWRAATKRDVLWRAVNFVLRQKIYIVLQMKYFVTWNVDVYFRAAWRAATSFEFHITLKNTCCITDVMIGIFCRRITWLGTWMCTFVWHDELRRTMRCCDELWTSYCGKKYMFLYYRCDE
jgi:hypothetical protein